MTEPVKTEVLLKGKLKMNFLSQHQFDTATKNPNELYYVPDSTESDISASIALHNNSQSSHPYILEQLDNKISKYSNFSAITDEIHDGDIVEYVGPTDSVSGFTNGYFYQANGHQVTVGQILPSETTASSLIFTFDVDTYLQYWTDQSVSPAPTPVTFTFDGTNWTSTETGDVDVATLGTSLGITYTGTASQDDEFIVALSETTIFTWLQKNVQPATSLEGLVTDVQIHGDSKKDQSGVADLSVVEQCDQTTMPAPSESLSGRVVQYIGTTNQDYTHGYFYECKMSGAPSKVICTATDSSTLYPYHITIDKDVFETQIITEGEYIFNYNGTNWTLNNNVISLDDYGISIQEGITYSSGDNMYIQYTESTIDYNWSPISVQSSVVFRRIVEEE